MVLKGKAVIHKDQTLMRTLLFFIVSGTVWIFGVKNFIFPYEAYPNNSLEHFFYIHLSDFLFLVFAAWLLYRIINKSYQRLNTLNGMLQERETELLSHKKQIETLYEKEHYLRSIMSVVRDINAYLITAKNIDDLGKKCCNRLSRHSDYRLVWIGRIEEKKIIVQYYSTDLTGYLDFKSLPLPEEHGKSNCPICWAIEEDQTIIINDIDDPTLPAKLRSAVESGIYSLVSLPLKSHEGGEIFGAMNIYSANKSGFSGEEVTMLEELAGDIGFAIHAFGEEEEHKRLETEKLNNYEQTLFSMINLIESRDSYTAGHTQRVARYCTMIAEEMGHTPEEITKLHKAAMLHDIGKIQTPDAILLKPGKLGNLEYELIQEHVTVGYNMLRKIDMYKELAEIMRHHHEHFDGSGYPDGLSRDEIPPLARIMIVADAFDAMTTSRIYKPRMSLKEALNELQRCAGTQFHPDVVEAAFIALSNLQLETAHQLPTSRIESERLAYFYKDRLTGTFSYEYLQVVLHNPEVFGTYRYLYSIFLKDFTRLNKEFGWTYGDWILEAFGNYLNTAAKKEIVFRRHGDDFLILSKTLLACTKEKMKQESPLAGTKLDVHMLMVDLEQEGIYSIDEIESYLAAHPTF